MASRERRERVLAAASRFFARAAYSKVSAESIAREAGVSKGLIFNFFGDKQGLYDAVFERTVADWSAFVTKQLERHVDDPEKQLACMLYSSFDLVRHAPMQAILMSRGDIDPREQSDKVDPSIAREWCESIEGVLRRGVGTNVFRDDLDCGQVAFAILELQRLYLMELLEEGGDEKLDFDALGLTCQLLLAGLRRSAQAAPSTANMQHAPAEAGRRATSGRRVAQEERD
ncbi:MAG: TetR/AcrR family transcriptional regulator [Deltaproteobacteria bacterium]|nr:TetR/AcrR family transcriptional regulator [Deltaproteobacteria bacterium]